MKRLFLGAALFALATGAAAETISEQVISNLRAQGFEVVQMDRTWLGRMWILSRSATVQREVVFNPATGEILRDYAVLLAELNRPKDDGPDGPSPIRPQIGLVDPVVGNGAPPVVGSGAPLVGSDAPVVGGGAPVMGDQEQVEAPVEQNNPVE